MQWRPSAARTKERVLWAISWFKCMPVPCLPGELSPPCCVQGCGIGHCRAWLWAMETSEVFGSCCSWFPSPPWFLLGTWGMSLDTRLFHLTSQRAVEGSATLFISINGPLGRFLLPWFLSVSSRNHQPSYWTAIYPTSSQLSSFLFPLTKVGFYCLKLKKKKPKRNPKNLTK